MLAMLTMAAAAIHAWPAPEADQGVAVDGRAFYAIDNSTIAKYDRHTGQRLAVWSGDPKLYPHINSCVVVRRELVCAASNFPATPMESRVEVFDPQRMVHLRTIPLGRQGGSLTWADWHDGAWWAGFANYDGHGGEPGRDHTTTKVMTFDADWKPIRTWRLPAAVLARMKPMSASGGAWGMDGRLYISGHDRPEVYALSVPAAGDELKLEAALPAPINGQAIAIDPVEVGVIWGIRRGSHEVVSFRVGD
jgi:hypothetical protein